FSCLYFFHVKALEIKPTVKYYMSIWLNALFQQKNYFLKYLSFHWKPMIVPFL
ncbi:hypothetical protein M138_4846, partial [Bacteroides fragilis str. S23L17]